MPNIEKVVYEVSELDMSPPETLTVNRAGDFRYESHTNWHRLEQQEIGEYAGKLPDTAVRELFVALADPPLGSVADHAGKMGFDAKFRKLRIFADGTSVEKITGEQLAVDGRLKQAFARLDEVAKLALRGPKSAVRLDVSGVVVRDGRTVEMTVTWSNPSTEPVSLRAPASLVGGENGWLEVRTWADSASPREELRVKATRVEEVARSGGADVVGSVVKLPPRATLSYRATAALKGAEDGPAFVRVSYANFVSPMAATTVVTGELLATTKTRMPSQ